MAFVHARNVSTGGIDYVPEKWLTHKVFGKQYVSVNADEKPYLPEMYKPKSVEEFVEVKKSRKKDEIEEPVFPVETEDEV